MQKVVGSNSQAFRIQQPGSASVPADTEWTPGSPLAVQRPGKARVCRRFWPAALECVCVGCRRSRVRTASGSRSLTASRLRFVPRVADWTFDGTWPFEPNWFDSPDGRMHYVDVGPTDGRPVVLVHGNPTWGYLYRNFIPALVEAGHRAIVPDHLGFGRSDKPPDPALHRVPRHAQRLDALLESLDLRGATVVPQDWGCLLYTSPSPRDRS